jgi:hypothetical protein
MQVCESFARRALSVSVRSILPLLECREIHNPLSGEAALDDDRTASCCSSVCAHEPVVSLSILVVAVRLLQFLAFSQNEACG